MDEFDLRSLEIFRAVAAEGSISRAAEKLNRVQSNISTRVKQLEERFEKPLFLRSSRGLTLTAEGHLLLSYADRLLQLSQEASEAMNEGRPRGPLRIGTMESTAAARLPALLSRFHGLYPEIEIEIRTDVAAGLVDRLLRYEIEVAFIAEPVDVEGLHAQPVFEEELVLVAPETFPTIRRLKEFNGRTIVAFESGCAYRRYLQDWLLEAGIVPGGTIAVSSYLAMLACVSAGTGFAVAPSSVLDMINSKGRFRRHKLPERLRRIRTLLCWRAEHQSAKLDALRTLLPALK